MNRPIHLTKKNEHQSISLSKEDRNIRVNAIWTDNGDDSDENDDLDLRASLLMPNGDVHFIDCERHGSTDEFPFIKHTGDVQHANEFLHGSETILINPNISTLIKGPISIVFSVYSSVKNGAVSISSLSPKMVIESGEDCINCALNPYQTGRTIYTFVIGVISIDSQKIHIKPGGQLSRPGSEATPWPHWNGELFPEVTLNGPPVMKNRQNAVGKVGFIGRLLGRSQDRVFKNIG
ncbi:hypothetical protein AB6D11_00360 [Vibrio splendidus]